MKQQIALKASLRTTSGKQQNRRLRGEGFIPAIVYRRGKEAVTLQVDRKELAHALQTERGENVLINLSIEKQERTVIIKELQHDPIRGNVIHVDFHEISLTERLKVHVPIKAKGQAVGVKQDGGVLEHVLWEIEAECLPTEIPDQIEVDVTPLKIGDSVHIRDLAIPPGVKVLQEPDLTVLIVKPPVVEVAPAAAEGEAATEPEVITEKKAEERAAAEATEEGKKKEEPKPKPAAKGE